MKKRRLLVATHDEKFHADEVFAIAILKKVYPNLKVVRSRDSEILKKADMRVDVGGQYNFRTKDFDHHQIEFYLKRENGIPYSSCGLIWENYGRKVVKNKKAFQEVDEKLIQFIDAEDNGIEYSNGRVPIFSVGDVIDSYGPTWENNKTFDEGFFQALGFAEKIVDNEIRRALAKSRGEKIVEKIIKNSKDEFAVLPKVGLPNKPFIKSRIKFRIFRTADRWVSVSVKVKPGSFEIKKSFPKSWAGLEGEKLKKVSGVKDALFCHKNLFIVAAKTKEAAIEMTKIALKS